MLHKTKTYMSFKYIILVLFIGVTLFTACEKDEDNNVRLDAFGPSPALRGGELRFLGENLDKVTEVILPENILVSSITVISSGEIRVTLPQEVVPGLVTLKTNGGETITTKTPLTISEPISIEKFYKKGTEGSASVIAGDSLVIEGDYLNLVREVIFSDRITVSLNRKEGVVYPRKKITVAVPIEAQTGKITLSNGAEIPILVDNKESLSVAEASVISISPATIKAGEELTIKGKNLQLISKVKFQPDLEIEIPAEADPFADRTEIKVSVPEATHDGEVTLVSYSKLEIVSGELTMVVPTITSIAPNPVKGGTILIIKGTNLDLVTNITFPNVDTAVDATSNSGTEIAVTVPVEATDGKLMLNTNSGHTTSVSYNVVEPTVTSTSSPIVGGKALTFNGTNLDLVAKVSFEASDETVAITSQSATSLIVTVPNTVFGSKKAFLTAKNGNVLTTSSLTIAPTNLAYITSTLFEVEAGKTVTLEGGNFNKITKVTLENKDLKWSVSDASTLFIVVPASASSGNLDLALTTADGVATYKLPVIGSGPIITSLWNGSENMAWNAISLDAVLFASVEVGDIIKVTVEPSSINGNSQGSFKNGSWSEIAQGTEYFTITGDYSLTVTEAIKESLRSGGLRVSGQSYVAIDISILH